MYLIKRSSFSARDYYRTQGDGKKKKGVVLGPGHFGPMVLIWGVGVAVALVVFVTEASFGIMKGRFRLSCLR